METRIPMKNLNVRISEQELLTFEVMAWYLGVRRSDLVRFALTQFLKSGKLRHEGKLWKLKELIDAAFIDLEKAGYEPKDFIKKRKKDVGNVPLPTELEKTIKRHVEEIKKAWGELDDQGE